MSVKNILNNLNTEKEVAAYNEEIAAAASAKKLCSNDVFGMLKNGNLRVITILGIAVGCASTPADEEMAKQLFYGLVEGELTEDSVKRTVNRLHIILQSGADLLAAGVKDVEFVDIIENKVVLGTYVLRDNKAYDFEMNLIAEADPRLKDEFIKEDLTNKVREYLLEEDEYDDDDEDEDNNQEIAHLKYLLNKGNCCPLDKAELIELDELIGKYGYPEYR